MRLSVLGALAPLCLSVLAEKLVLEKVERVVKQIIEENIDYVNYDGPSENATLSEDQSDANITAIILDTKVNVAATTYWYEAITKQGLAPQAATGYAVYRNVLDYGATG